jgi:hypothetical protein
LGSTKHAPSRGENADVTKREQPAVNLHVTSTTGIGKDKVHQSEGAFGMYIP